MGDGAASNARLNVLLAGMTLLLGMAAIVLSYSLEQEHRMTKCETRYEALSARVARIGG